MSKTVTKRGFSAPCIRCGVENSVQIYLCNVTTFNCSKCNEEWTVEDLRDLLSNWQAVLTWVETAPELT